MKNLNATYQEYPQFQAIYTFQQLYEVGIQIEDAHYE